MQSMFHNSMALGTWINESAEDEGDFVWQSMLDYWDQTGQLDGFDGPDSAAGLSQSDFDQLGTYASYGTDLNSWTSGRGHNQFEWGQP